jgi:hypothetical protein
VPFRLFGVLTSRQRRGDKNRVLRKTVREGEEFQGKSEDGNLR